MTEHIQPTTRPQTKEVSRPNWSAVFSVAFCVACLITVEFLPVSLLTPMAQDLGISVIAHSACREDEQAGRLAVVPLEKPGMVRRINMVHHQDFSHPEILEELRRLYIGRR